MAAWHHCLALSLWLFATVCGAQTSSPTTSSPTTAPTTCVNYRHNYSTIDGADVVLDAYATASTYDITLLANSKTVEATTEAQFIGQTFVCDESGGCNYRCVTGVSCLVTTIICNNSVGCNIYCIGDFSCGSAQIYVNAVDGASLNLVCQGSDACNDVQLFASKVSRASVHCLDADACDESRFEFDVVSQRNNSDTFVACYAYGACDSLNIFADGAYTQLLLYEYSANVHIHNGDGYFASLGTVQCGLGVKYIQLFEDTPRDSLEDVVRAEFIQQRLPCSDVHIGCDRNASTGLVDWVSERTGCVLQYYFKGVEFETDDARFTEASCVHVWLSDIVEFECRDGTVKTCLGDATVAPTPAPTDEPTFSPTAAPSTSPSAAPTGAPSFSPTRAPTAAPSAAPTFSPTRAPSGAPTFSPSRAPTHAPTFSPSNAPTFSPTQAPTRGPTPGGDIYDTALPITYILNFLSASNIEHFVHHNETRAVVQLTELIERHYFHPTRFNSYEFFWLRIEKLNGYSLQQVQPESVAAEALRSTTRVAAGSVIEFNRDNENYVLSTSESEEWAAGVTAEMREVFNNSELVFQVLNASLLEPVYDLGDPGPEYVFIALNAFLGLSVLVGVLAMLHNQYRFGVTQCTRCVPVDSSNWISIILYGLQIYDMVSDINLTIEIYQAMLNRECEINPVYTKCAVDGNLEGDDPEKWDTLQEWALFFAGVTSLIFLLLPYALNIGYAARITAQKEIRENVTARTWFDYYQMVFILLVVLSGGCYPSLGLVSSRVFGFSMFETGLSAFELSSLSDIRVITTVMTENGPQLLVQIAYTLAIGELTPNTILAFVTSIMSIVASALNYFINKDKEGQTYDIYYYWEVRLKESKRELENTTTTSTETEEKEKEKKKRELSEEQIAHIRARKGIKLQLTKKIVKVYPDIDKAHFEIGYVTLRKDNFVIRVCQHLHEQDLNDFVDESQYDSIRDEKKREQAKLRPFQNYCYELYATNRTEIENLIFEHYEELDSGMFEIRYHKEYPSANVGGAVLKGKDKQKNVRALIGIEGGDDDDDDEDEEGGGKKKDKSKATLVSEHRDQFKRAFEALHREIDLYREENPYFKDHPILKETRNSWKLKLKRVGGYDALVIEDAMRLAESSGLFVSQKNGDSDLDSSEESQELFEKDKEFQLRKQKERHMKKIINPVVPTWATERFQNQRKTKNMQFQEIEFHALKKTKSDQQEFDRNTDALKLFQRHNYAPKK